MNKRINNRSGLEVTSDLLRILKASSSLEIRVLHSEDQEVGEITCGLTSKVAGTVLTGYERFNIPVLVRMFERSASYFSIRIYLSKSDSYLSSKWKEYGKIDTILEFLKVGDHLDLVIDEDRIFTGNNIDKDRELVNRATADLIVTRKAGKGTKEFKFPLKETREGDGYHMVSWVTLIETSEVS